MDFHYKIYIKLNMIVEMVTSLLLLSYIFLGLFLFGWTYKGLNKYNTSI